MNRVYSTSLLLLLFITIHGCSTSETTSKTEPQTSSAQKQLAETPDWFLNPPADGEVIYGTASAQSMNREIAKRQAQILARQRIAQKMESKVEVFQEHIQKELMTGDETETNDYFGRVIQTMTRRELNGTQIEELEIKSRKGGSAYEAFILMKFPKNLASSLIDDVFQESGDLYNNLKDDPSYQKLLDSIASEGELSFE